MELKLDSQAAIDEVVLAVVAEMAPAAESEVRPETTLVDGLGFDSLGLLELTAALEDALDLPDIDIERLGRFDRVADVQRLIREVHDERQGATRPNDTT